MNFSESKENFFFPQARQVRTVLQHCLWGIKSCRFNTGQQTSSRVQTGQAAQWNHLSPPFTICKATGILWLTSAVLLPGKYAYLGNNKSNQKSVKHILFFLKKRWLMEHGNSPQVHQNLTKQKKIVCSPLLLWIVVGVESFNCNNQIWVRYYENF